MALYQQDHETGEVFYVRRQRQNPGLERWIIAKRRDRQENERQRLLQTRPVTGVLFKYDKWSPSGHFLTGAFMTSTPRFCYFSEKLQKHWWVTLESHLDPEVLAGRRSAYHLERTVFYHQFVLRGENVNFWWGQTSTHYDADYVYQLDRSGETDDSDNEDGGEIPSWKVRDPIASRTRSKTAPTSRK